MESFSGASVFGHAHISQTEACIVELRDSSPFAISKSIWDDLQELAEKIATRLGKYAYSDEWDAEHRAICRELRHTYPSIKIWVSTE